MKANAVVASEILEWELLPLTSSEGTSHSMHCWYFVQERDLHAVSTKCFNFGCQFYCHLIAEIVTGAANLPKISVFSENYSRNLLNVEDIPTIFVRPTKHIT